MFCTQCGKQIPDDSLFCVHCGKKIMSAHRKLEEQKAQEEKPASTSQPEIKPQPQVQKPAQSAPVPQKPKKKKAVWPWILILALLIIAGLTAGVALNRERIAAFLMGDGEPQKEELLIGEAESLEETLQEADDFFQDTVETVQESEEVIQESLPAEEVLETETEKTVNVEEEISKIREVYYSAVEDISAGEYIQRSLGTGTVGYWDQTQLRCVKIKGNVNNPYDRSCYYYDDELVFAYYEEADSHRFYFADGEMIRWRHCADATNISDGVDHDLENTDEYNKWKYIVKDESNLLINAEYVSDYILPDSNSRYLTKEDIRGLSAEQCRLARNEIYARYGRTFNDEELQTYFDACEWYIPSLTPEEFSESMLNDYEIANRDLIVEYEEEQGYR